MTDRYRLLGSTASPYALKLRAILRYRRLPHDWVLMTAARRAEVAHVRPNLIPMLRFPGEDEWRTDTTVLAHELEARHAGRSVQPTDPAAAFLSDLLEDLADEWLVKSLFLYRWSDPVDQDYVSRWAAEEWGTSAADAATPEGVAEFRDRQIGRMPLLGATEANRALLEATFRHVLAAFEGQAGLDRYLFGSRPSLADFAFYGQLSQLAIDPTPMALMRELAPRTEIWCRRLDDASGVDGTWAPPEALAADAVARLLELAGGVYLPFLAANAEAHAAGAPAVAIRAWGHDYAQAPFRYQAKCLARLRARFAALPGPARARLQPLLRDSGCWRHLAAPG